MGVYSEQQGIFRFAQDDSVVGGFKIPLVKGSSEAWGLWKHALNNRGFFGSLRMTVLGGFVKFIPNQKTPKKNQRM